MNQDPNARPHPRFGAEYTYGPRCPFAEFHGGGFWYTLYEECLVFEADGHVKCFRRTLDKEMKIDDESRLAGSWEIYRSCIRCDFDDFQEQRTELFGRRDPFRPALLVFVRTVIAGKKVTSQDYPIFVLKA